MKRLCSLLLVFVMCFSLAVTANAEEIPNEDVTNSNISPRAEEAVVYNAAWFYALRTYYLNSGAHFTSNTALESGMGYIYNQNTCPQFYIGLSRMASVGCEIAAVYNAIKHRGLTVPCASIIKTFEESGYLMTEGFLGSDPFAIGDYFDNNMAYQLTEYTNYNSFNTRVMDNIDTQNVYIVSFWNTDSIFDGLHTVCFYTTTGGNKLYVYNLTTGATGVASRNSLSSFVDSERFIVGYFVPRMGRLLDQ